MSVVGGTGECSGGNWYFAGNCPYTHVLSISYCIPCAKFVCDFLLVFCVLASIEFTACVYIMRMTLPN